MANENMRTVPIFIRTGSKEIFIGEGRLREDGGMKADFSFDSVPLNKRIRGVLKFELVPTLPKTGPKSKDLYRKKPVEIEARPVPEEGSPDSVVEYLDACLALADWCGGVSHMMLDVGHGEGPHIAISTLEGVMRATPGDWILKGVHGEFYPCKPDIFAETYERVL